MLKINRNEKSFSLLETPTLASASITERYDLQEFISNSSDAFFKELGLDLFLLGKEVEPSKTVQDRIDLLAVDKEGRCVIVELKRGNHKLQMFQAISYAGMIAQWSYEDLLQLLDEEKQEELADFLEVDPEEINREQKIVLVAEAFDYALLIGAEWLSDTYSVDIMCCRIALAKDSENSNEFLVCSNVYPAPELAQEAVARGQQNKRPAKWADWESALAGIENPDVLNYFKKQLAENRESYLRYRDIIFRIDGKRRWFVKARQSSAYVWQRGRFDGDIEFWKGGLSDPLSIDPVKKGKCLRFYLTARKDFKFFHKAFTTELQDVDWISFAASNEQENSEEE